MSKLNEMLRKFCPDGVVYKRLGDVCSFQRGISITKSQSVQGDIPVLAGGQKPAYYHNEHNREKESIVVSGSGG